MSTIKEKLNLFFVQCFYDILRQEEKSLEEISNGKLSLKEIHVIEAIYKTEKSGENTSGGVAKCLGITLGSLTVAVNVLEKKGYIIKTRDNQDKRITYLTLTELGRYVNNCHEEYHKKMINDVVEIINEDEQRILIDALIKLQNYFKN